MWPVHSAELQEQLSIKKQREPKSINVRLKTARNISTLHIRLFAFLKNRLASFFPSLPQLLS